MNMRYEAALAGLLTYETAKRCPRGHPGIRYTSCGNCVQCTAERNKQTADAIKGLLDKARQAQRAGRKAGGS